MAADKAPPSLLTSTTAPPRAPGGLGSAGKRLHRDVTTRYGLRADELRVLEQACRTADALDRYDEAMRDASLTVKGSQGQLVMHPIAQEARLARGLLASLLKQLGLPDEDGDAKPMSPASRKAQHAALMRWKRDREKAEATLDDGEVV